MYGERRPFRIGAPAAASLAVNGALLAVLLGLGAGGKAPGPRLPALTSVSLAVTKGAEKGEEEAEPTAQPAAATPAAAPSPPAPEQRAVLPPVVPLSPLVVPVTPGEAKPVPVEARPVAPAAPAAPAVPAKAAAAAAAAPAQPARKGAADGLAVRAPSGTGRGYAAKIQSWIHAHKIYPRRSRMRHEEGVVQVRFTLDRAGMLLDGAVLRGSGFTALDEEAMAVLRRASPFPRAPVEVTGERIEFTVPIEFSLSI
ncbi:energy transducer TonB [Novosphingobium kaempferiae]|uniref:energy transducer TonB n=1 Tax=Novosphingobium kaempferiae TaxID=2896849 RepID=UPI001E372146|nr:energy transducer TonB [Novosphingobium kaempferiae]